MKCPYLQKEKHPMEPTEIYPHKCPDCGCLYDDLSRAEHFVRHERHVGLSERCAVKKYGTLLWPYDRREVEKRAARGVLEHGEPGDPLGALERKTYAWFCRDVLSMESEKMSRRLGHPHIPFWVYCSVRVNKLREMGVPKEVVDRFAAKYPGGDRSPAATADGCPL
jgi:hypothetical protein